MKDDEKEIIRPVEADGIQEYDNQLPRWWLWLFCGTIVYGTAFWIYKEVLDGESIIESYNDDIAEIENIRLEAAKAQEAEQKSQVDSEGGGNTLSLAEKLKSPEYIAEGKATYASFCLPCHGPDGGGTIGPNLTDHFWLHGSSDEEIVKVISNGVPEKGMVAWLPVMGKKKVEQAAAYIISLIGTTPAKPKPPQGEKSER